MPEELTRGELEEIRRDATGGFWQSEDEERIVRLADALEEAWDRQEVLERYLLRALSMVMFARDTDDDYEELMAVLKSPKGGTDNEKP